MTSNDQTPDPTDQQIAHIKAHFTRRIDTLLARAERAEQERVALAATVAAIPDAHHAANLAHARTERDQLRRDVATAHAAGYAEAVARLRDDARYLTWWTSDGVTPDAPIRQHLADYLETVGPDPSAV